MEAPPVRRNPFPSRELRRARNEEDDKRSQRRRKLFILATAFLVLALIVTLFVVDAVCCNLSHNKTRECFMDGESLSCGEEVMTCVTAGRCEPEEWGGLVFSGECKHSIF